jgi:hypothetical protein
MKALIRIFRMMCSPSDGSSSGMSLAPGVPSTANGVFRKSSRQKISTSEPAFR